MKCVRYPTAMKAFLGGRRSVVTIGAYDGIHKGHQALLRAVQAHATEQGAVPVVMSFEPTPKEFFAANNAPARLTNFRERALLFDQAGMQVFFCLRFSADMASISVDQFIDGLLVDTLNTRHLVIGDDFRFGQKAAGGVSDLIKAGKQHGFSVEQIDSISVGDIRASSTAIRQALALGEMGEVRRALGRPYTLSGKVIKGQQLGRTLGYPTANIALHRRVSPVSGIFAVRVSGAADSTQTGVASIGTRPTVDGQGVLLEVHLFDFDGDLYGKRLEVELVEKIREEIRFDDLDTLTAQMHDDAAQARKILSDA